MESFWILSVVLGKQSSWVTATAVHVNAVAKETTVLES